MKPEGLDIEVELMMEKLYGSALAHLDSTDYAMAAERLTQMMTMDIFQEVDEELKVKPKVFKDAPGWYQDADGNLYKYDGVVWDVVPDGKVEDLEFLG